MDLYITLVEEFVRENLRVLCSIVGLTVLFLYVRFQLTPKEKPIEEDTDPSEYSDHVSTCQSPDCVRCNLYKAVAEKSQERLETFMTENCLELQGYVTSKRGKKNCLDCDLGRIQEAVTESQNITYNGDEKQQPNVLYVRGLESRPWWTEPDHAGLRQAVRAVQGAEPDHAGLRQAVRAVQGAEPDHAGLRQAVRAIQDGYDDILEEYNSVSLLIDRTCGGWTSNDTANGSWDIFYLYNQGREVTENTELCPNTVQLIQGALQDDCMTDCVFGNVFFSKLYPGTHIDPHYGSCNIRIRCHLGLSVPEGWSLTVDGETHSWTEGKCILFDDSFLHSVSHQETNLTQAIKSRKNINAKQAQQENLSHDTTESCDDVNDDQVKLLDQPDSQSRDDDDAVASNDYESAESEENCRVMFILDLWHPDLTAGERKALSYLYKTQ